MTKFRSSLLALAAGAALFAGNAGAATTSSSFTVSIQVQNNCTVAVGNIDFGTVNDLSAVHTASSTATVTCSGNGGWDVAFSAGDSSNQAARSMDGAVAYNLYTAAVAGSVLGDGNGGTVKPTGNGSGSFTVYARTVAGQPMVNGTYSDSITATLTY
ncbi:Csu type fimbrial protein [Arenimonas composti]|uniref:Spore coat protein U/FanG domain-containing protein n=1 Tax=Arenimonas composti TR7-09 = DSM 18010 TaxID=1121013 RepID=A0A091BEW7_9GAMM|nr:spore coat protein U domain-containing protein [Arenimonas composti]KFN50286.1 hypothetical protein P873_06320 [Arenimonas composti TR7-09 = DSM 18010]